MGQTWICAKCGMMSTCDALMMAHVLINHLGCDLALTSNLIGTECFRCLWDGTMPFRVVGDGKLK